MRTPTTAHTYRIPAILTLIAIAAILAFSAVITVSAQSDTPDWRLPVTGLTVTTGDDAGELDIAWNHHPQTTKTFLNYRVAWAPQGEGFKSADQTDWNVFTTGNQHTVTGLDAGATYQVKVRTRYEGNQGSRWTDVVTGQSDAPTNTTPANAPATGQPTIAGTPEVGETLTTGTSAISDDNGLTNANFAYQWVRSADGSDTQIPGATGSTYLISDEDLGHSIKVQVSFTDDDGYSETLTSNATATVPEPTSQNNAATGQPTVSGTAEVGETLTAGTSAISDDNGLANATFNYQWVRSANGTDTDISGATASSHLLSDDDLAHTIKVQVSFTDDDGYSETLTSQATDVVVTTPNTAATGQPTIAGTTEVGETLTAGTSAIADANGLASAVFSHQWVRSANGSDNAITDATGSTYVVTNADVDAAIKVRVSFTDDEGHSETLTSNATTTVPVPAPVIVPPEAPQIAQQAGDADATPVLNDWSLIPSGLGVDDSFRLIFLSSTKRNASSTSIGTYNTWAQGRAAAGHADIQAYSSGFTAIGCTVEDDARDNTGTTYTSTDKGVPIYWLNGNKVADEYEDFYDGSWDDEARDKDESGNNGPDTSQDANFPFTGCDHDGTEDIQTVAGTTRSKGLGTVHNVRLARPNSSISDHGPLSSALNEASRSSSRPMYGLSGVFTIVDELPPITLVSNTGQTRSNESGAVQSQPFTTGSNLGGYTLTSVDVGFQGDNVRTRLFHIVPNKGNGEPDLSDPTKFITLTTPRTTTADKIHTFAAPADARLAANTTYHLLLANSDGGVPGNIHRVSSQAEDDGGAPGWSIGNKRYWRNGNTGPWSDDTANIVRMQINGRNALPSTDATLSNLVIEGATSGEITPLSPAFDEDTFTYTAAVAYGIDAVTLTATTNHSGAMVAITDDDDANTKNEADLDLDGGANTLTLTVTAEDTSVTETYTITVTRERDPTESVSVPIDWSLIPSGISSGDQFRLLFLSGTRRDGSSSAITDYNTFVQGRAAAGHTDIQAYSDRFMAVGCTEAVDARDNTATTYTSSDKGVPIYWLDGNRVADNYQDFYDGDWDDESNDKNEDGNNGPNTSDSANYPLTGCSDDGTEKISATVSSALGNSGDVTVARPNSTGAGHGPLSSGQEITETFTRPMYGLSAVFTVEDSADATLSNISIEGTADGQTVVLSPDFDDDTLTYTARVGHGIDEVTLTATKSDSNATVVITGDDHASTPDTADFDLSVGPNTLVITVTAMDTTATLTYTITVTRADSDSEILVPGDWSLIPSGLGAGASFRLLFLSSTRHDASSASIDTYNDFVQGRAANGHIAIQAYSDGFTVVGCTQAVDARDNTRTTFTSSEKGIPIYWLNGNKVADEYEDFYDGSWDDEANDKNQSGNNGPDTSDNEYYPLTGCSHDGTERFLSGGSRALGSSAGVTVARPNSPDTGHGPLSSGFQLTATNSRPMYGLSAVFMVMEPADCPTDTTWCASMGVRNTTTTTSIAKYEFSGYNITDSNGTLSSSTFSHESTDYTINRLEQTTFTTLPANTISLRNFYLKAEPALPAGTILTLGDRSFTVGDESENPTAGQEEWDTIDNPLNWTNRQDVTVSLNLPSVVPDAPTNLRATPGGTGEIDLTWRAPADDGSDTITGYKIEYSLDGDSNWTNLVANTANADTEYSDASLSDGTTRYYRVSAINSVGTGPASNIDGATVGAPLNLNTVHETWGLIPTGLGTGDQFRLIFGTSGKRDATAMAIGTYNTFVQNAAAAAGHTDIQPYSDGFRVVGSTADTDARDNTSTTYTSNDKGIPIYWLGGTKVADDYEDFYDETWDDETNTKDESGSAVDLISFDNGPYTGSTHDGVEFISGGYSLALGSTSAIVGAPNNPDTSRGPIYADFVTNSQERPFYGLSAVFIVDTPNVPDAPTFLSATPSGTSEIELSWHTPASNDGSPIAGYKIEYSLDGESNWTTLVADTGNADTEYSDAGLSAATTRYYRVSAINSVGTGPTSNVDGATVGAPPDLNTIPETWSLIPSGLGAGDQFRLIFGTSGKRDATAMAIGTYNTFVQNAAAAAGHTDIQPYSDGFRVVGSTAGTDARDNTATTFTATEKGVPIYWLGGTKVADDYEDFYDETWDDETNTKDESGSAVDLISFDNGPYTGSSHDGVEFIFGGSSLALGTTSAVVGAPNSPDVTRGPIYADFTTSSQERPFYGLSEVFIVGTPNVPGPPRGLTANVVDTSQIDLEWKAPSYIGGATISGYKIEHSPDGSSNWTNLVSNTGHADITYSDTGLSPVTTRYYRVFAINSIGTSSASNVANATTTQLDRVTGVTVTPSNGALSITWTTSSDATGYKVRWKSGSQSYNTSDRQALISSRTTTNYVISGLNNGTLYTVRVTATKTGADDGPPSSEARGTPAAILPTVTFGPGSFTASENGATARVTVEISVPADVTIPFRVQHRNGATSADYSGVPKRLIFADGTTTRSFTVTAVDDSDNDDNEKIRIHLEDLPAGFEAGTRSVITVKLKDNDEGNSLPLFDPANELRDLVENTAANQNVGLPITATDADGDSLTYTFSGPDMDRFTFTPSTAQLRTKSGQTYDYETHELFVVRVTADDGNGGTKTATVVISVRDVDEPPPAPTGLTLEQAYPTSMALSWTPPDNAGRPAITDYDLQYRKSTESAWTAGLQGMTSTSGSITGLDPSTSYHVQVRANNDEGAGAWSSTLSRSTPSSSPGISITKTNLTVTEGDQTGRIYLIVLGSQPTADVHVYISGYDATTVAPHNRSKTFNTGNWDAPRQVLLRTIEDADTTDETVTITHRAESDDTDYEGITVPDLTVKVIDNDTPQVTGVWTQPGDRQLTVNWTATDKATGYKVQWKAPGDNYNTYGRMATITSGSTTTYTIPNLTNGTEYTVMVTATWTGHSDGPRSDEATGTPTATP